MSKLIFKLKAVSVPKKLYLVQALCCAKFIEEQFLLEKFSITVDIPRDLCEKLNFERRSTSPCGRKLHRYVGGILIRSFGR